MKDIKGCHKVPRLIFKGPFQVQSERRMLRNLTYTRPRLEIIQHICSISSPLCQCQNFLQRTSWGPCSFFLWLKEGWDLGRTSVAVSSTSMPMLTVLVCFSCLKNHNTVLFIVHYLKTWFCLFVLFSVLVIYGRRVNPVPITPLCQEV